MYGEIDTQKRDREMSETLTVDQMLPTKFEPLWNRRFIFCLDGLDAFLVRRVDRPSHRRVHGKADIGFEKQELVVYLYSVVAPSTEQQVEELMKTNNLPKVCAIKLLDSNGTVVNKYSYSGVHVERVDFDSLDYSNNSTAGIKLTLSFATEFLEF